MERISGHTAGIKTEQDKKLICQICLPVQELQVGDLSTLIIRAPLSQLLKKKEEKKAKKGVNQADLQLAWNYFRHFERKCWRLQAEEGRNLEMKT